MKSVIFSFAAVILSLSLSAQSTCDKLTEAYSAEEISKLQNPEFLCFVATQGYLVNDMGDKDLSQYPDISTLKPRKQGVAVLTGDNFDLGTFNLLNYEFNLLEGNHTIYRIGDTGKTLFLHSKVRMEMLFDRYLINQNAAK